MWGLSIPLGSVTGGVGQSTALVSLALALTGLLWLVAGLLVGLTVWEYWAWGTALLTAAQRIAGIQDASSVATPSLSLPGARLRQRMRTHWPKGPTTSERTTHRRTPRGEDPRTTSENGAPQESPELSHRLLTPEEAATIWEALQCPVRSDRELELRIHLKPGGAFGVRGWLVQTRQDPAPSGFRADGADNTPAAAMSQEATRDT